MGLYRCCNPDCPAAPDHDFEAEVPVCPECKADGRQHAALVLELACIHYLFKDVAGPIRTRIGNRRIACMPARAKLPKYASGERAAVNCPKCKASKAFVGHEAGEVSQHEPFAEARIAAENGFKGVVQGP